MDREKKGICFLDRRDFMKTAAAAVVGSTLSCAGMHADKTGILPDPGEWKRIVQNRKLLCLSGAQNMNNSLIESIKSNPDINFRVSVSQLNIREPKKLMKIIKNENPGMLLLCLGPLAFNYGRLSEFLGFVNMPIVAYCPNKDLIMVDVNFAAELRARGAKVKFANSENEVIALLKKASSPGIIEGEKALIYGRPFDSASVPAHNLTKDYVYDHTGVEIQYRPVDDLKTLLENIDKTSAVEDMKRWKKEAKTADNLSEELLLDQCRMYVLLRSIIEKEKLSAISIDCLSFTLTSKPILPIPCLAFARLRDEGITAACEADVCGLLTSMAFEKISGKPSYFANVASVDAKRSSIVFRHCVAPLKFLGLNSPQLPYHLHDYHGFGTGLVPRVEFPVGIDVTMGAYTKDLKSFLIWSGKTCTTVDDTDQKTFYNGGMDKYCSNKVEVKINDFKRFYQNVAGLHYIIIEGNYMNETADILLDENVNIIGPLDS